MSDEIDHNSGFDEARSRLSGSSIDVELERLLAVRGRQLRTSDGMVDRITRATLPSVGQRPIRRLLWVNENNLRWGVGLAAAALFAVAFVLTNDPIERTADDGAASVVSSMDSGGTSSEPLLVSLIAGSDTIPTGSSGESDFGAANAMSLLRTRDASFGDLDSEVQTILASASPR